MKEQLEQLKAQALAALQEADPMVRVQEVKIGDVTWKQGDTTAASASSSASAARPL